MKSKLGLLLLVALVIGAIIGAACAGEDEEASPATPVTLATPTQEVMPAVGITPIAQVTPITQATPTAVAQAKPAELSPKFGGVLDFATFSTIASFDPKASSYMTRVGHSLYQTLTTIDPATFEIRPEMAKSWEFSPDFMTLTLKLQEGVKFQNGEPFNADAVVWHVGQQLRKDISIAFQAPNLSMKKATKVDEYTVKIDMAYPYAGLVRFFDMVTPNGLIPPVYGATSDFAAKPVGIGPFKFEKWTKGVSYEVSRYDGYWRKDKKAWLDGIKFYEMEDENLRIVGLLTGQLDLIERVPGQFKPRLDKEKNLVISTKLSNGYGMQRSINTFCKPFDNVHARRAFAYAVPKQAIVDNIQYGLGEVMNSIPNRAWLSTGYHDPNAKYLEYNLDKAREELKLAGYPDGFSFDALTFALPSHIQANEMIVSELKKIGVKMNMAYTVDFASYGSYTTQPTYASGAEPNCKALISGLWHGGYQDIYYLLSGWIGPTADGTGCVRLCSSTPELQKLLIQIRGMQDGNPEKVKLVKDASKIIMEEVLTVPLYAVQNLVAWKSTVHGFVPSLMDHEYFFYDTWMERD